jgi:tetratricopeptide (TPR) repeat protein
MELLSPVKVWEEEVIIPTYGIGKPEKNPIFFENRVYQGSSGAVYPLPVIEKILDEKTDRKYRGLFLENRYLKIMILPEIGGRVQMAFDKIKQRHFIYYNQVIKPALVGLTGPWISGGIEFNWPQHHRPSTFDPIDFTIEEHSDGSKTVWVSEVERMFRTKGMAGFRLYPDKAFLEVNAKLYNRTPFPQTFLWWTNPAVKVNEHYQSVFPPDVNAVFDHGKRDVSEFPIAKGTYYKVDYSAGVDISRYKNIPVPTSYMAVKSNYDFIGGYEHDTKGGLLHVANHHVSPGKKQWTWGNGAFGHAWDRNLTDEDGPYVELMTGIFTDNQPDFSWIQPYEEKSFTQYFMPYSELGVVKNATKDGMVNLEIVGNRIIIKLYATSHYQKVVAKLLYDDREIWVDNFPIAPENPVEKVVSIEGTFAAYQLKFSLHDNDGREIVSYRPEKPEDKKIPKAAEPAKDPNEIETIEQLFLTGLHIEQYRHATYRATDYYEEALRREPFDVRNNNAMGLWFLKRGKFLTALTFFQNAISTLTQRNSNPYDGEPLYNAGLTHFFLENYDIAFEFFYKSTWNAAWQDTAYLHLSRIATRKGNFQEAIELINKSIDRNYTSQVARHLKVVILRKLNKPNEALKLINESLELDKFNFGCHFEKHLILASDSNDSTEALRELTRLIRANKDTYIEYAFDYAHAGLYSEAIDFLTLATKIHNLSYPMLFYYMGYFKLKCSNLTLAKSLFEEAQKQKPDYCFPNRIEDISVLETVMSLNPMDSKAPYYLGNFWYANRQYDDAISCWEKSAALGEGFPTVHRNLALSYHNKQHNGTKALASLEKSFSLDNTDARVLMELDQLYKKLNKSHEQRLSILERHIELTLDRDDLYLERIILHNQLGQHQKAKELLRERKFHPWEGGEGKVVGQYVIANLELAKIALEENKYNEALNFLKEAENYPENLGEGKLYNARENDLNYLKGCAYEGSGQLGKANEYFTLATEGMSAPGQAIYYNDQQPDKIFYQGLAWKKLGRFDKAEEIFNELITFGTSHLNDTIKIDYFAVSLPDLLVFDQDLDRRNKNHCLYLIGLGYLGLNNGKISEAIQHFDNVLLYDINHLGAQLHLKMAKKAVLVM